MVPIFWPALYVAIFLGLYQIVFRLGLDYNTYTRTQHHKLPAASWKGRAIAHPKFQEKNYSKILVKNVKFRAENPHFGKGQN